MRCMNNNFNNIDSNKIVRTGYQKITLNSS